ncbi:uroporphyrinogen decarboxylase family protein [Candidatus Solincola sp.]|nr:uroporphyrinogen decarboxylase family protein [Actinomycetota bacterium]
MLEKPFKNYYDFDHLRRVLLRETTEGPVPIIELLADPEIMSAVTGLEFPAERAMEIFYLGPNPTMEQLELGIQLMDLSLAFSEKVGYDYVTMVPVVPIPRTEFLLRENPVQDGKLRGWQDEHRGLIMSRSDFEAFPWPSPEDISLVAMDYAASKMPEGMKVMAVYTGIFEDLKRLMGFENMALKSIEEPDLCGDILEKLTELAEAAVERCAAHPAVGAVFYAEDMGFNRSLMLSPAWMRQWVIPRLKRIADACHRHDKPFLLHSCGQIDALMEDLIHMVGIDARHSFQDNIEPVEQVYRKYHDRIAILGGLDVDLLARGTPQEVRRRTRQILEVCAPGGGFCMGSGNSLTNYIKIENYYAMLDETRKWNEEHYGTC